MVISSMYVVKASFFQSTWRGAAIYYGIFFIYFSALRVPSLFQLARSRVTNDLYIVAHVIPSSKGKSKKYKHKQEYGCKANHDIEQGNAKNS